VNPSAKKLDEIRRHPFVVIGGSRFIEIREKLRREPMRGRNCTECGARPQVAHHDSRSAAYNFISARSPVALDDACDSVAVQFARRHLDHRELICDGQTLPARIARPPPSPPRSNTPVGMTARVSNHVALFHGSDRGSSVIPASARALALSHMACSEML